MNKRYKTGIAISLILLMLQSSTACIHSVVSADKNNINKSNKDNNIVELSNDENISFTALAFMTSEDGDVNNVALNFTSNYEDATYVIKRKVRDSSDNSNVTIYNGKETVLNDYDLEFKEYIYTIEVYKDNILKGTKQTNVKTHEKEDKEYSVVDNVSGTQLKTRSNIKAKNGYYYKYDVYVKDGKVKGYEYVSNDGYNFSTTGKLVLDENSHSMLSNCKLESIKIEYAKDIDKVVLAAHWEKPDGYADGKLLLATCTPGKKFKVHDVSNPEGIQVRDMSIFIDDDGSGYLLAAANKEGQGANDSIYIFNFKKDFTATEGVASVLFEGGFHEMPNVVKNNGYYYLFMSQTAGWYPSEGSYASSKSMSDGWSELKSIGNTSTFSSQSSWIVGLGEKETKNYMMHAYRWIAGDKTSDTMIAPITFDNGSAFYDYYPKVLYDDKTGEMIPISNGKNLAKDCEISASIAPKEETTFENAVDGNYRTPYIANETTWPITFNLDLKKERDIDNIQLSWYMCKGSEGYYMYTIEGSNDNKEWTMLYDNTDEKDSKVSKTYGFNYNQISKRARYIRINVTGARLQNNPDNNWYTPTLYEVKVFGK